MELILIRHGLPERIERADGLPADPALSALGHDQAARAAAWLASEKIDRLYTSPLQRARDTAAPLAAAKGLVAETLDAVAEMDADSDSYIPLDELKRVDYDAWRAQIDGGLTQDVDVPRFLASVRTGLATVARENPGRRVAVACHAGVINAWAADVLGLPEQDDFLFFEPMYTSIHRFFVSREGKRSVGSLNETAHLREDFHHASASRP